MNDNEFRVELAQREIKLRRQRKALCSAIGALALSVHLSAALLTHSPD
jgi:hypothetical protein